MTIDAGLVLSIAGPLFCVLGAVRWVRAGRLVPQARAWLLLGVAFTAVALWLRFGPGVQA